MSHALHVWAEEAKVATIEHEGRDDRWGLRYAEPWVMAAQSYPLSPALALARPGADHASASIKRFIEHLLPEGRTLDVAVAYNGLAKSSIFGLIWALGAETAGALRFTGDAAAAQPAGEPVLREIPLQELDQRIAEREHVPLTVWDGQVRMSVAYKYERNLGSAPAVSHIRDGVSFERLFGCADLTANKAASRLAMLRWALFQFLIGNSDAHGKNFSFFVRPGGLLEPTPWYDLVSVLPYDGFDTEMAMAYGDVFNHAEVSPFALADFAARCGIDRKLMRREGQRLAKLAATEVTVQAQADDYVGEEERAFIQGVASFVTKQAQRLSQLVAEAAHWKDEHL